MDDKTELMTSTTHLVDGITGHTDEIDGQETKRDGLFRGTRIKFSKTCEWEIGGQPVDPALRLIFVDIDRIITRWGQDRKPIGDPVVLKPGERWPDISLWNDKIPHTEWIQGPGGLQGSWKKAQIVHFLDPKSMGEYHWADSTTGGSIAIKTAIGSIKAMRRFRPGAAPVVELSDTFMPTQFGGRQRPHFVVHSWISLPGEESQPAALLAPTPAIAGESITLDAVEPVSLSEEMNDVIPF